jgi:ceramide glucosyltransferase
MSAIHACFAIVGVISAGLAAGYAVVALAAVGLWLLRRKEPPSRQCPPVTILKPLCGAEPSLYENLRSFCQQRYPEFQIVFGVRDPADPALAVVTRLQTEFPTLQIDVVVDPQQHGSNRKISNLINMMARARYDTLSMADSDARVTPEYLATVTAPLLDPRVGLVTCPYHGEPTQDIWSRLGAMYINEWYIPSVLLARLFGHEGFASGQTLCIRRDTLQAIGGLEATANYLAEDNRLGELVRGLGLRIVLSSHQLEAEHHEPTLQLLVQHELRWLRTIQVLRPRSFRFLFITFSLPLALLGLGLTAGEPGFTTVAGTFFVIAAVARLALHLLHRLDGERHLLADIWLLPVRDLLLCWIWCRSFFISRITWRGSEFDVRADGTIHSPS